MTQRYQIMNKSITAHCCFSHTIMDTTKPQDYSDEFGEHFDPVCECFSEEDAQLVCQALNQFNGVQKEKTS